jgi:cellobiose phosphorylase
MPEVARDEAARVGARYRVLFERRSIQTPDPRLNEYVNHWLPLQLDWVQVLDRGWATGMRGTRDAAQDARALAGIEPTLVRQRLCESLSLQRSDGWFLRQYSTAGRAGTHDSREYVDSGCWVWELLREYLYQTRDFQFLGIRLRWLDSDGRSSVLEHAVRLFEYYLDRENVGEHGLCKIREGDWNDSANRAGLEGRGESVMVSCQVVLGLREIAELLEHGPPLRIDLPRQRLAARYRARATKLSEALLRSALNRKGYFNALFADSGRWLFSPNDPDGQERVYGPANAFALIAGVVHGAKRDRVLEWLGSLKGPHGWRLFHPPIDPSHPVPSLGRLGQGDLLPGIAENGAPYNHGSHGFGGRAAWTCGKGELLYELLRYMLPYDQLAHPVEVAKTAPYAVVNHWREALGLEGSGGDTFLSGSIATALLNCYEGMVGFRPGLSCLTIDPCIPRSWRSMSASVPFLGGRLRIEIQNAPGVEAGVARVALDGHDLECLEWDSLLERYVARIPIKGIRKNRDHSAVVTMGAKRP